MKGLVVVGLTVVIWITLRGQVGPSAWLVGAAAGLLFAFRRSRSRRGSLRQLPRKTLAALHIAGLFAFELLLSNVKQLKVVFGPTHLCQPHWLHFETALGHPALRALFGVLISLTPGTLTCELDTDGTVWVHVLVAEDDETVIARLRHVLEEPLRRLEA